LFQRVHFDDDYNAPCDSPTRMRGTSQSSIKLQISRYSCELTTRHSRSAVRDGAPAGRSSQRYSLSEPDAIDDVGTRKSAVQSAHYGYAQPVPFGFVRR